MNSLQELLPLILPLLAIQLVLIVVSLLDLRKPERRVRGGSKVIWGIVVVCVNLIGPLIYLTVGRQDA